MNNYKTPQQVAVHSIAYHMVDTSRKELHANDAAHSHRELMVHVWYSADKIKLSCPVLIYSHGLMGLYDENKTLCEHLARCGYVVVSIAHTYASNMVEFPDGRKIASALSFYGLNYQQGQDYLNQEMETWIADTIFVIDQLEQCVTDDASQLYHMLDMNKIGIFGYSFGGALAVQMCRRDNRIKCGIDLDGPLNGNASTSVFHKPFMFMMGSLSETRLQDMTPMPEEMLQAFGWSREDEAMNMERTLLPAINKLAQAIGNGAYKVIIKGAKHASFIDGSFAHIIIRSYVVAFFDTYMRGHDSLLLKKDISDWPEVMIEKF